MIKEFQYKGHTIRINPSEADSDSPREYEPYGTFKMFHHTYDFGDANSPKINHGDFSGWDEMKAHIIKEHKAKAILPVYMYDHSSRTISTEPFPYPFDSGQVGFIWVTEEEILKGCGRKTLTKKLIEDAEGYLKSEISTMNQYINDDCYGYVIDPEDEDDEEGAFEEYAGGIYDIESAESDARACIDRLRGPREEREFIEALADEELPKYVNYDWKYPTSSDKAFRKRLGKDE